ncbi:MULTISPECIES: pyridoxal 5'-phosphate synthase glutaminase subunit PdxT [Priestia]|jgi:pyridoxal 5'-phosphate synthase pdxT subunit|uniref:Pyridoxal 5'-phosphate synthase subunit PdxT n=2 Tax=Priestia TaxID=2800373 RepID=A0A0H4KR04_9BACI|nr:MULTISPECIES: pyridoxal 5'-phosphate synthase glutaminase subunit PdxT [Priestia]AKO90698.1 glutamine amidotransferase subunit PdxT [Priestia filamentosa]AVD54076.1 pyridoxal 5'-phosphate synthase glutaminase subunit PdxT [Priestia filamentosa]KAB2487354.1 pyridoxal 5'-phosphate synthase glutaminase subunit PdxT [Priestia endophytica]KYG29139.1 glutamine amidotransferase [Priestia endophytica]MBG9811212.1 glutamine amidotransferase [Priestia endophytica]
MTTIGILALQGAVREHAKAFERAGAEVVLVKKVEQLESIDGLVLPGGESTTMRRLIDKYGFMEPLKAFAAQKKPMFGTCAGLILLASDLVGYSEPHLGVMDIKVERNSFGRQRESFEAALSIKGVGEDFIGVFIRAPHIVEVGQDVEVLAMHGDRIVAAQQGSFLGCSFHPELTDDYRLAQHFVQMVETSSKETV